MAEEAGKVVEAGTVDQSTMVGDVIAGFGVPAAAPKVEAKVEAKPTEEAPVEEQAAEEKPVEEAPKVEEKPKEEKPKEEPKSDSEVAMESLRKQVLELTEKLAKLGQPQETKPVAEPKPEPKPEPKHETIVAEFFESQEEYDKAFEDRATFNKVLLKVRSNAVQDAMRAVPQIINHVVKEQVPIILKTEKFFQDNKDLADKKQFVGFVANELSGKNPDWTVDKLFGELGKEVRGRLGLKQEAQQKVTQSPKPAFVRGGGSRKPPEVQPDLSTLESQIADILPNDGGIRR